MIDHHAGSSFPTRALNSDAVNQPTSLVITVVKLSDVSGAKDEAERLDQKRLIRNGPG